MTDDLISRQAAMEILGDIHPLDYNAQAIKAKNETLPSAEPLSGLHLRSQAERLTIAETLLAGVWEEMRQDCIQDGLLQLAVDIQVNVNRIVWKLNEARSQDDTQ